MFKRPPSPAGGESSKVKLKTAEWREVPHQEYRDIEPSTEYSVSDPFASKAASPVDFAVPGTPDSEMIVDVRTTEQHQILDQEIMTIRISLFGPPDRPVLFPGIVTRLAKQNNYEISPHTIDGLIKNHKWFSKILAASWQQESYQYIRRLSECPLRTPTVKREQYNIILPTQSFYNPHPHFYHL
jgi:hypothetical protein